MNESTKWNIPPLALDLMSYRTYEQRPKRSCRAEWSIYATGSGFYRSSAFNVQLDILAYQDHPWWAYVSFKHSVALLNALSLTPLETIKSGTFVVSEHTCKPGWLTFMISME